ncbi:MAG: ScyD/ScyE family protein, partial [Nocardioidaceae bacterium]
MKRTHLRIAAILTSSAAVVMTTGALTASNADPSPYQVVASGLNNPRHLSFGPHGDLFVAEAGSGGPGTCINGSDGGINCFGWTGSITEVTRSGHQFRVLNGLGSLATQTDDPATPTSEVGTQAIGPAAVSVGRNGRYVITMGLGAPTDLRAALPRRAGFATLLSGSLQRHGHGHWYWHRGWHKGPRVIADLGAHEAATNPVDNIDTDPSS